MTASNSNQDDFTDKREIRAHEAKIVRRIVFVIFIIFIIAVVGAGIGGYSYISSALEPADPEDKKLVDITIPIGSSGQTIANILEENGIIKDATIFRYYIKFKNESGFQAGDYKLSPSMEISDIIEQIKTGKVIQEALFSITIPEGKQLEQIATIVEKKTSHLADDFLKKVNDEEYIKKLTDLFPTILNDDILNPNIKHPLEGYLYPATYDFYEPKPSLETIIEKMLSQTELIVTPYLNRLDTNGVSVHEMLTMASLIEEEATQRADRNTIAGVFYNRINANMPLQTDPTILYALGQHQVRISYADLEVESPYNTYTNRGLPPGPIANAGESSIIAALEPSETDYYYFYARANGEVIFTSSLEEHNRVKNQYRHEWDALNN